MRVKDPHLLSNNRCNRGSHRIQPRKYLPPPSITISSIRVLDPSKPVLFLTDLSPCICVCFCVVLPKAMPRFLRRIFSEKHLSFRKDTSTQDDVQQSRRVITKSTTARPETRLRARLSQLNLALHPEEIGRPQDGASLADSDMRAARPILAPSIASHERCSPAAKTKEPRRRLSKRHRMPDLKA